MPSPQIENGHLDLANELVDRFCTLNLSPGEWRVLWAILRKTYGWHKKMDRITYSQFEEMTKMDHRRIRRYLKRLIGKNIITRTGAGRWLEYGLQKDYSKWQSLFKQTEKSVTKQAQIEISVQTDRESVTKQTEKSVTKHSDTKEKKETIQKKECDFDKSLASLFSEIESDFTPEELQHKQEFLDYWTEKNPNGKKERWQMEKVFDVKRRYQTWLRKSKLWSGQTKSDHKAQEIAAERENWGKND
ncbi:MAG TPA: replication protein [Candidatus Marinimicrobia bacterium]|nr:replication protein [Candidatus Neomarinimicrobiota bacterium]HRS51820.1 replication protein [Candidatus Neomarinimicrobiota bacterium]HRU92628.1 replication protein [Candidatus Neomarinimicrobiota bacterium]